VADELATQTKMDSLEKDQNTALERLIQFRDKYLEIDNAFKREIKKQSVIRPWYRRMFDCMKN
jgi:hypothetical protein